MKDVQLTPEFAASLKAAGWGRLGAKPPPFWPMALLVGAPLVWALALRGGELRFASARVDLIVAIACALCGLVWLSARLQWRKLAASQDLPALALLADWGQQLPAGTVVAQTLMLHGARLQRNGAETQSWPRLWLVAGTEALFIWQLMDGEPRLALRWDWPRVSALSIQPMAASAGAAPVADAPALQLRIVHGLEQTRQQLVGSLRVAAPAQALTALAQQSNGA